MTSPPNEKRRPGKAANQKSLVDGDTLILPETSTIVEDRALIQMPPELRLLVTPELVASVKLHQRWIGIRRRRRDQLREHFGDAA